jgi:hypothetical protein
MVPRTERLIGRHALQRWVLWVERGREHVRERKLRRRLHVRVRFLLRRRIVQCHRRGVPAGQLLHGRQRGAVLVRRGWLLVPWWGRFGERLAMRRGQLWHKRGRFHVL